MPDRRPLWLRDAVAARNLALRLARQCELLGRQAPAGGAIRALVVAADFAALGKVVRRMERRYRRERG